jgi:hypothetical protein
MFTHAARRRRRWRRRRRLAVLTAAAIAVTIVAQHAAHPHLAARPKASRAASSAPRTNGTGRVTFGPGFRWLDYHGIALPVSATAGPRDIHNGLSGGFTDTPAGAVLAAVNIAVRTSAQWGPRIYQPTINHHVIGPAAGMLLAADNSGYAAMRAAAHAAPGQPVGRAYAVEAAYRLVRYTLRSATTAIVSDGPASNGTAVLAVTRIHVRWLRGDWRVVAPPRGTWASSATTVASLSGYTSFPSER